jgi:sterol 14-demethylase
MFFEHPSLDLNDAQILLPFGVHFWPPIHDIFVPRDANFQKTTYWLKTLAGFIKTPNIQRCLSSTINDADVDFRALVQDHPSGVVNSPDLWKTVFKQNCRMFLADEIADNPKLFNAATKNLDIILHTFSPFYSLYHWIPEPSMIRRRFARYGLQRLIRGLLKERDSVGSVAKTDPLQTLINNGDPYDYIVEFMVSAAFITTVNAHVIAAQMINTMAIHVGWQEKVYAEILGVANKHCPDEATPLVEKLQKVPLASWENSFPIMDICLDEVIRVWTSFPCGRYNVSPDPIPIPGSDEVIPGHTYAVYNTTELHFNESLYPRPTKFDPGRFTAGREEFKQEPHGCKLSQHMLVIALKAL